MSDYSMYKFFRGEKECPERIQRCVFVAFRDWNSAMVLHTLWDEEAEFDKRFREWDCCTWWSFIKGWDEKAADEFMKKSESFYPETDDSPSDRKVPERFKRWLFDLYLEIYLNSMEGHPGAKPIYESDGPWESLIGLWIFKSSADIPRDRVFVDTDIVHPLAEQWIKESAAM